MYILFQENRRMARKIQVRKGDLTINESVEVVYEKVITPFGNSAKIDAPKKYIGKRAYVIIIKD
jgi:putative transposon-encoded protein